MFFRKFFSVVFGVVGPFQCDQRLEPAIPGIVLGGATQADQVVDNAPFQPAGLEADLAVGHRDKIGVFQAVQTASGHH
ncbi:hypothetical protein D3C85_967620 [compost metagenome]